MAGTYYANVPISEPALGFNSSVDLGGFGWDPDQGLCIPAPESLETFEAPSEFVAPYQGR